MNSINIAPILAAVFLASQYASLCQNMDKEFSSLAEQLASQIKESGKKKLTVLDFTDLQGNGSELGRFVAEQLAVSLLSHKQGFSLMDRANLKTILAEHKLTVEGLVDPENAKKLGQFAGVDAIILGNTTPLKDDVVITAKVIATDTAEIVGAVKGRLTKTADIDQLLSHQLRPAGVTDKLANTTGQGAKTPRLEVDKNSQVLGDLLLKVESLKPARDTYGRPVTLVTLFLVNTNATSPIAVAFNDLSRPTLVNRRGDSMFPMGITGVAYAYTSGGGGFSGEFTEVGAGESRTATITFYLQPANTYMVDVPGMRQEAAHYPPYRLQAEIYLGNSRDGRLLNVKKHNFVIEIESTK